MRERHAANSYVIVAATLATFKYSVEEGLWQLDVLPDSWYKTLLVITEILRQQSELNAQKSNQIDDRMVRIEQPHVRPIYRGKAGRTYEFGSKVSVVLDKGFAYLETVKLGCV